MKLASTGSDILAVPVGNWHLAISQRWIVICSYQTQQLSVIIIMTVKISFTYLVLATGAPGGHDDSCRP